MEHTACGADDVRKMRGVFRVWVREATPVAGLSLAEVPTAGDAVPSGTWKVRVWMLMRLQLDA